MNYTLFYSKLLPTYSIPYTAHTSSSSSSSSYLFIYQVTSYHKKKKTATSCRSITKASKYAIPLKPTHKLAESMRYLAEVESSRTSLASRTSSRTHFEVLGLGLGLEGQVLGLGLGLEASSPRKLPCPRLEDNTIF